MERGDRLAKWMYWTVLIWILIYCILCYCYKWDFSNVLKSIPKHVPGRYG